MSAISRLRFGVPALALVAALVLVALHFDCVRPGGDAHMHPAVTAGQSSAVGAGGHVDLGLHVPGDDCCSHQAHCVLKSALPTNLQKTMFLGLVLFLAIVALAAVSVAGSIALAVRGPPPAAPMALTGRRILTRLCIARR
ncbi:hypothetical protein ACIBQ0_09950 [Nocardia nova]|uniref:hypothetical protein n=1 Tax=Nocardia nova TaxID=37330 RepID=UPI003792A453